MTDDKLQVGTAVWVKAGFYSGTVGTIKRIDEVTQMVEVLLHAYGNVMSFNPHEVEPMGMEVVEVNVIPKNDPVDHPKHYNAHPSGVECIDVIEHMGFSLGNAIKYIWRADLKHDDGGVEDLKKAKWYIEREIARRTA